MHATRCEVLLGLTNGRDRYAKSRISGYVTYVDISLFPGSRETWGEVGHKVGVQRIQQRVLVAEGHEPRGDQVVAVTRRSADRGGAAAAARHHRPEHPRPEALSDESLAVPHDAAIPYC